MPGRRSFGCTGISGALDGIRQRKKDGVQQKTESEREAVSQRMVYVLGPMALTKSDRFGIVP
jgi:hypothetical protein